MATLFNVRGCPSGPPSAALAGAVSVTLMNRSISIQYDIYTHHSLVVLQSVSQFLFETTANLIAIFGGVLNVKSLCLALGFYFSRFLNLTVAVRFFSMCKETTVVIYIYIYYTSLAGASLQPFYILRPSFSCVSTCVRPLTDNRGGHTHDTGATADRRRGHPVSGLRPVQHVQRGIVYL